MFGETFLECSTNVTLLTGLEGYTQHILYVLSLHFIERCAASKCRIVSDLAKEYYLSSWTCEKVTSD